MRYLRAHGWEAVRSASSKSSVDVWAVKVGEFALYQCSLKRTRAKERAVREASMRLGFPLVLVTREDMAALERAEAA